jgi:hypothetical protein
MNNAPSSSPAVLVDSIDATAQSALLQLIERAGGRV